VLGMYEKDELLTGWHQFYFPGGYEKWRAVLSDMPGLAGLEDAFNDPRLPELLFRYRARNHPDSLDEAARQRWNHYRQRRLLGEESLGELNLQTYRGQLDLLAAEAPDDARRSALLQALRDWGQHLEETL